MKKVVVIALLLGCTIAPAVYLTMLAHERGQSARTLVMVACTGAFTGFGFFAIVGLVLLFAARSIGKPPVQIPLSRGEEAIAELRANHFLGIEGRGGTMVVTNRRLLFHPHRYNVQISPTAIELSRIDGVVPWLTTLRIDVAGRKHRFVVHDTGRVAELVRDLVRRPEEDRPELALSFSSLTAAKRRALSRQS